jgi:hypothetical protein
METRMIKNGMAAIGVALLATLAHADDYLSPTDEHVRLSLGVMHLSNTTDIRLDSGAGVPGTPINAESVLGLNNSDFEVKFQAMVRVGEVNRLRFDYFTLDRTGQNTLPAPVIFRDVVLQAGEPVESSLSMRLLGITHEYSFIHNEKFELAVVAGINDADISAQARQSTPNVHVNQTENVAGPFPTLGLDSTYVISKRFYIDGRAQYFKVSIDHDTGSLGIYELDALYRLRPNVSFALGYTAVKAILDSRKPGESGRFDFDTKGPEIFVRVAF